MLWSLHPPIESVLRKHYVSWCFLTTFCPANLFQSLKSWTNVSQLENASDSFRPVWDWRVVPGKAPIFFISGAITFWKWSTSSPASTLILARCSFDHIWNIWWLTSPANGVSVAKSLWFLMIFNNFLHCQHDSMIEFINSWSGSCHFGDDPQSGSDAQLSQVK